MHTQNALTYLLSRRLRLLELMSVKVDRLANMLAGDRFS